MVGLLGRGGQGPRCCHAAACCVGWLLGYFESVVESALEGSVEVELQQHVVLVVAARAMDPSMWHVSLRERGLCCRGGGCE